MELMQIANEADAKKPEEAKKEPVPEQKQEDPQALPPIGSEEREKQKI